MLWSVITIIGSVVVLLVVIELLNLPDWLGSKLRGTPTGDQLKERLDSIEERLANIEKKL